MPFAYQNLHVELGEAGVDNKAKIVFLEILWGSYEPSRQKNILRY